MASEYWAGDSRSSAMLRDHTRPILEACSLEGHRYQLDPYMGCSHQCCYCYALVRNGHGWFQDIEWYDNMAERLSLDLANIKPQAIYMGWNSDPYQPIEAENQLTRNALSLFAREGFSATILTKSPLVTRDIDLLSLMPESSVGVSVSFSDEKTRGFFEEGACQTASRIEALGKLRAAGVRTYALVCPVIPFVTNAESVIRAVAPYADSIWVYKLLIRDEKDSNWQNVLTVIRRHFPTLMRQIADAVFQADHPFWSMQQTVLLELADKMQLDLRIEF